MGTDIVSVGVQGSFNQSIIHTSVGVFHTIHNWHSPTVGQFDWGTQQITASVLTLFWLDHITKIINWFMTTSWLPAGYLVSDTRSDPRYQIDRNLGLQIFPKKLKRETRRMEPNGNGEVEWILLCAVCCVLCADPKPQNIKSSSIASNISISISNIAI